MAVVLVHGFHPFAEDGGLYAAGIYQQLDPALFPHSTAFVRAPMRYSAFAFLLANFARSTHLPVPWTLLLAYIASTWSMLFAARELLHRCVRDNAAQFGGLVLLCVWWTLPIAGTSLLLMDPYVTARSFCTPLSLLVAALALDHWKVRTSWRRHPALLCCLGLLLAVALHQLMAAYALAVVVFLRAGRKRRRTIWFTALFTLTLCLAWLLQHMAKPEPPAQLAADITRYYWFLSQWQWFEWFGLVGPLAVLFLLLRGTRAVFEPAAQRVLETCLALGFLAGLVAMLFAHQRAAVHAVARLQPLRIYLFVYAVMAMFLGAFAWQLALNVARRQHLLARRIVLQLAPALVTTGLAAVMFFVQRESFAASWHLELPWRAANNPNPWIRAFLWARQSTPADALFAMDANYITTPGEDAQTFRAIALRSCLPDYSKDGGEASVAPALVAEWQAGAAAQQALSQVNDQTRLARLQPFGVNWVLLHASAPTRFVCPYENGTVKVCRLPGKL